LALDVRDVQTTVLPGTYKLRTAVPYQPCNGPAPDPVPAPAAEAPLVARIAATGQMRKWHVARVDFCPFQYDPATGQIRVVEQATVELRFARTGERASADLLADTVMDDVAAAQFVNYAAAARAWYPPADRPNNAVTYDYVIVTTKTIGTNNSKLAAFIAHQQKRGYSVRVVTEDDYGDTGDRADRVRAWLQEVYTSGIKYVLLIGNPTPGGTGNYDLPMKMCWAISDHPTVGSIEAPTDYYFADLSNTWDKDGDGRYGEYNGDYHDVLEGVDLFPEVYVGRIPFYGSFIDLAHILQKTMDYQNETSIGWRRNALLPMSFMGPGDDGAPFAEQMWDDFLGPAGYSRWRMYQQGSGPCEDNSAYPSDEELVGGTGVRERWVSDDYGIVCWYAHGGPTLAGVGYPATPIDCGEGAFIESSWTNTLDDDHPSFTYQSSCSTGWPEDVDNLQYAILKRGGIATVGATRGSFNGPFTYGDFDQNDGNAGIGYAYLHRVVNGYTASEALYQATFLSVPYIVWEGGLHNFYVFNLYGDPTVRITDTSASGKSRLTIPAAAFTPYQDGYDYENHGRFLIHKGGPEGWYFAPVHLPHGAQVTKMIFNWYNNSQTGQAQAKARLQRTEFGQGNYLAMAYVTTGLGGIGGGSSQDDTIAYATIDNVKYAYWANFDLPATTDVRGCSVVIEYIPPTTVTGRLSIPAAAFRPYEDGYDYQNHARFLKHLHSPGGGTANGWYLAPVFLPHGAKVTKMTFHYYDTTIGIEGHAIGRLQRTRFNYGDCQEMASVQSAWAGYGSSSDTSILYATIDNSQYAYWVDWDLPVVAGSYNTWGCGVVLEYDQPNVVTSKGYVSIPAAAFTPLADEYSYQDHGRYLIHKSEEADNAHYEAPTYLPQGATVTRVSFYYKHDALIAIAGHAHLCRTDPAGNYFDMSYIPTMQSGGFGSGHDYEIVSPIVDNSRYGYWAYWDLPISGSGDDVWGCGMVIEYTYSVYLPVVLKNK
ncbi:MAG: C25 family cysteine peptidase, partial [Promethearchaeota archaeon]